MFAISDRAAPIIQQHLRDSGFVEPVGEIGGASRPLKASPDLREAILEESSKERVIETGVREFSRQKAEKSLELTVFVRNASEVPKSDLVTICGVLMRMPKPLQEALAGHVLDFGEHGFFLRKQGESEPDLAWNY